MENKLNGFNNGRDTTDGVGVKKPFGFSEQMNYTRPNDPDHIDDPKEWLNTALIFGGVIGTLLEEGTGIVIDVKGDMYNPVGESKKVIVLYKDKMIHIDDFAQDLPEGTLCKVESSSEN